MGDLLRVVRVLGAGLGVLGRYRAARWIGLVVAVGWLVLSLAGCASAAGGPYDGPHSGPVPVGNFTAVSADATAVAVGIVCCSLGGAFFLGGALSWAVTRLLLGGFRLRGGAGADVDEPARASARSVADVSARSDGDELGSVTW